MKSITTIFLILSIISVTYCHQYSATINLGNQNFDDVEGSIKMKVHLNDQIEVFRLIQT